MHRTPLPRLDITPEKIRQAELLNAEKRFGAKLFADPKEAVQRFAGLAQYVVLRNRCAIVNLVPVSGEAVQIQVPFDTAVRGGDWAMAAVPGVPVDVRGVIKDRADVRPGADVFGPGSRPYDPNSIYPVAGYAARKATDLRAAILSILVKDAENVCGAELEREALESVLGKGYSICRQEVSSDCPDFLLGK